MSPLIPGDAAALPDPAQGDFGAIAGNDLDGDLLPEIACLRGTRLYLTLGSEYIGQATPTVEVASDALDLCSDKAGAGFLFTSSQGLHRLTLVAGVATTTLLSSAADWIGAIRVRSASGPGGAPVIVGVSGDAKRLFASAVSNLNANPTLLFQLGAQSFTDVCTLDWDGDPANGDELATLTTNGMQIRQQDPPVTLVARAAIVPGDAIAAVKSDGETDALVWITQNPPGVQNLLVFHEDFSPVYQIQMAALDVPPVHSISVGQLNDDKHEDLVLKSLADDTLRTIFNGKGIGSWNGAFTTKSGFDVPMALSTPTPNPGRVLVIPLWNNPSPSGGNFPDLALGLPGIHVLRRVPWDFVYPEPSSDGIQYLMSKSAGYFSRVDYDPCAGEEAWVVRMGIGWGINLNANAIQVKLVRYDYQGLVNDEHTYSAAVPQYHRMYEYPGETSGPIQNHWAKLSVTNPAPEATYFAQIRPVRLSASNSIVQAWNWALLSMTRSSAADAWLESLSATDLRVGEGFLRDDCDPNPMTGGGVRLIPHPILQGDYPAPGFPAGTLGGLPSFWFMDT